MCTCPVVISVSTATREAGSARSNASRIASLIWSAILSGWPSVTDSEVNRLRDMTLHPEKDDTATDDTADGRGPRSRARARGRGRGCPTAPAAAGRGGRATPHPRARGREGGGGGGAGGGGWLCRGGSGSVGELLLEAVGQGQALHLQGGGARQFGVRDLDRVGQLRPGR